MDFTPLIVSGTILLCCLTIFFFSLSVKNFSDYREREDLENYKRLKNKYEKERH